MKAHLMYRDRDFDLAQSPPPHEAELVQDLELTTLFAAMSGGDKWLAEVVKKAVLASSVDIETIRYRQAILRDCLTREPVVRAIYDLAVETIESERKGFFGIGLRYPNSILHRSVDVLQMLVGMLRRLRTIADQHDGTFESEGFKTLFAMLRAELSDDYFEAIRRHLKQLKFQHGVLISAQLGEGNRGVDYVLRKENAPQGDWMSRLFAPRPVAYSFQLAERDESGARSLSELKDRGINLVANAMAQSTDHVLSFFNMLRTELAFYVGCLNLHRQLSALSEPVCFPCPTPLGTRHHSATDLYDVCLALNLQRQVVGNVLDAEGKDLVIITGANQGGKSTFLRSVGLSQLMMQCGMFVAANTFRADVCERIFTHYKREEDAGMESGKFDEELSRMSAIIDDVVPNSLVLFNESFASTNEREGSEIARQIVTALFEQHIKLFFVTHQYEFAHGLDMRNLSGALFLRAERQVDGARTFKIAPGQSLPTSYGEDLYRQIFIAAETARRPVTSGETRRYTSAQDGPLKRNDP
jgi:DNA mismatch repair ATPase MutS